MQKICKRGKPAPTIKIIQYELYLRKDILFHFNILPTAKKLTARFVLELRSIWAPSCHGSPPSCHRLQTFPFSLPLEPNWDLLSHHDWIFKRKSKILNFPTFIGENRLQIYENCVNCRLSHSIHGGRLAHSSQGSQRLQPWHALTLSPYLRQTVASGTSAFDSGSAKMEKEGRRETQPQKLQRTTWNQRQKLQLHRLICPYSSDFRSFFRFCWFQVYYVCQGTMYWYFLWCSRITSGSFCCESFLNPRASMSCWSWSCSWGHNLKMDMQVKIVKARERRIWIDLDSDQQGISLPNIKRFFAVYKHFQKDSRNLHLLTVNSYSPRPCSFRIIRRVFFCHPYMSPSLSFECTAFPFSS